MLKSRASENEKSKVNKRPDALAGCRRRSLVSVEDELYLQARPLGALDPAGIPRFSRSHLHIATLQCALSPCAACAAAVRWGRGTFDPPKGPPLIAAQH